jgi:hypothetical protein
VSVYTLVLDGKYSRYKLDFPAAVIRVPFFAVSPQEFLCAETRLTKDIHYTEFKLLDVLPVSRVLVYGRERTPIPGVIFGG